MADTNHVSIIVNKPDYQVIFKPESIIPDIDLNLSGN